MLRRVPFESAGPVFVFAVTRVVATALAVLGIVVFGLPDHTRAALLVGAVALAWTLFVLFMTRRKPGFALNPVVPIVDFSCSCCSRWLRRRRSAPCEWQRSSWSPPTLTSRASGAAWRSRCSGRPRS